MLKETDTDGGFVVAGADSQFKNIMEDERALRLWQTLLRFMAFE